MTESPAVSTPQASTTAPVKSNPMEMRVETNSAPVEQQSTETTSAPSESLPDAPKKGRSKEMVTTEPKAPIEAVKDSLTTEAVADAKPEPTQQDNDLARDKIREKLRADEYKRQLDALQPKYSAPEKAPDINDQTTWGDKYKNAPNDIETFLKARDEWAEAQGEKKANAASKAQADAKELAEIHAKVATRDAEARVKYSDYDAVVSQILPIIANIPILRDFAIRNAMGSEVMYELGRNPAILNQIMNSDMWGAGERLLNIAARLKQPKAVPVTQAPPPIKPVGSREALKPDLAQLASKDMNGYHALRKKQRLAEKGIRLN